MYYSSECQWIAVWVDTNGYLRESPFMTKQEAISFLKGKLHPVKVKRIGE